VLHSYVSVGSDVTGRAFICVQMFYFIRLQANNNRINQEEYLLIKKILRWHLRISCDYFK
jgi:hypothetical protein